MTADELTQENKFEYLLAVIADCEIDRPRRPRVSPRVVKVKVSKFKRKRDKHKSETMTNEYASHFLQLAYQISSLHAISSSATLRT